MFSSKFKFAAAIFLSIGFCFASSWYDSRKTVLEINNLEEFNEFRRRLSRGNSFKRKEIRLTSDIMIPDTGKKFKAKDFSGKFSGNGNHIRGLKSHLFCCIEDAVIKDLNIYPIASIVKSEIKNSLIENCSFNNWYDKSKTVLEINDLEELNEFRWLLSKRNSFKGKEIHLKADIMVFDTTDSDIWSKKIKPKDFNFFNETGDFKGKFYGNGHYIRGLYETPLFCCVKDAGVKDLNISHSYIEGSAIVKYKSKNSIVKNCSLHVNIGGDGYIGGVVKSAKKSTRLEDNKVSGKIIGGARHTGGIAGYITSSSLEIGNKAGSEIIEKARFLWGFEPEFTLGLGKRGISSAGGNIFLGADINKHFSIAFTYGFNGTWQGSDIINHYGYYISGYYILSDDYSYDKEILYHKNGFIQPIFLKPRIYFSENNISKFLDGDIGVAIVSAGDAYASFYFNPSFGLSIKKFYFSAGFNMWVANYEKLVHTGIPVPILTDHDNGKILHVYEDKGTEKKLNSAISFKLGLSF